jgi:hypothetical protein
MPKFKIGVIRKQTLEEKAEIEVEAESAVEAALLVAEAYSKNGDEAAVNGEKLIFEGEELTDCTCDYGHWPDGEEWEALL